MTIRCNQASLKLFKLWAAGLCALVACLLPQSLARPHEVSIHLSHVQPVSALSQPKVVSFNELSPVPVITDVYTGTGDSNLDYIVQHESSGNPYAINELGACGLGQALPCSKMGCALSDVNCQISWIRQYALERYGSTGAAAAYWAAHQNW